MLTRRHDTRVGRLFLISQHSFQPENFTMSRVTALSAFLLGLSPSIALAASEGGEGLINFDKSLIIQVVNFILLMIVLTKLLYRPLVAKMEERTQAIKKSLEEAQAARVEAQREREEHAAKIQAAHAEAQAIRAAALKGAAEARRQRQGGGRAPRRLRPGRDGSGRAPRPPGAAPGGERPRDPGRGAPHPQEPARRRPPAHRGRRDRPGGQVELITCARAGAPRSATPRRCTCSPARVARRLPSAQTSRS